jgi:hypothetical protein
MPFVIAASRDYLKRCGVPQSPPDLSQHDSIMIGNGQSCALAGLNDDIEVPARVVLRFGSMTVAVAHAVAAGIGLASLPRSMFEESAFTDVLCPVLTEHPLRQSHFYAIYVSRKYLPLKIRTFVDYLIERARIPPPWAHRAPWSGASAATGWDGNSSRELREARFPSSANKCRASSSFCALLAPQRRHTFRVCITTPLGSSDSFDRAGRAQSTPATRVYSKYLSGNPRWAIPVSPRCRE